MHRRIQDILRHIGLSTEEINLYRALLQNGQSTIPDLIATLAIPSSTAYRAIRRLQENDLAEGSALNQKQTLYRALSPTHLARKLASSQRSLRRMELALSDPAHFSSLFDASDADDEPVEVLMTLGEIREYYFSVPRINRAGRDLLTFGAMDDLYAMMGFGYGTEDETRFIHERLRNALNVFILCHASKYFPAMAHRNLLERRTTRTTASLTHMKNFCIVGRDEASLFLTSGSQPRVLRIRQPELIEEYRRQFVRHWEKPTM